MYLIYILNFFHFKIFGTRGKAFKKVKHRDLRDPEFSSNDNLLRYNSI